MKLCQFKNAIFDIYPWDYGSGLLEPFGELIGLYLGGHAMAFQKNGIFGSVFPVIFTLAFSLFAFSTPATPQVGAAIGVIGGSALLDQAGREFRETVDHARAAADALLGRADEIAKNRLNQIDGILKNTVGGLIGQTETVALNIIQQATKEISALEKEIYSDLLRVIWETECAGRRLIVGDTNTTLGRLGDFLGTGQIRLSPYQRVLPDLKRWKGECLFECDPYVVDVMEPFGQTYSRVRELMEQSISDELIDGSTPAEFIVGTYEYLSSFALKTSCFYSGSEDRYNREFVKYRELAKQWNNIVTAKIQ
ncbi:hypothetical protein SAMN05428979_1089 [Stappia sp. ES.058]|nr:hypothetical protein SAMN05428979_1089 [Stappia sp. ES.058]